MAHKVPSDFLATHRQGKAGVLWIPLNRGYLKLEYGVYFEKDLLGRVSFVLDKTRDAPAVGRKLELMLHHCGTGEKAVFIAENAISGLQWVNGKVSGGTTLDIDPGKDNMTGRRISLAEWVDECLRTMIQGRSSADHPPE